MHLLLTKGNLRAAEFQKALLAVGREDRLEWNHLEAIFDVRRTEMTDAHFANWGAFRTQHPQLVQIGPVEMLQTIVDRLEPLLGDFYRREEMPFLLTINADPVDESSYLIYSDWLEEHDPPRAHFLRLYTTYLFRAEELKPNDLASTRLQLQRAFGQVPTPWLAQLFGTPHEWRRRGGRVSDGSNLPSSRITCLSKANAMRPSAADLIEDAA